MSWPTRLGIACWGLGSLLGCGGAQTADAEAALSESTLAQRDLRSLEERWEVATKSERVQLRPLLTTFVQEHGTDPSVARARLLLGRSYLDEGLLREAEEALKPVLAGAPGRTHDEAEVIQAGIDNRRGDAELALGRLAPLEGKLFSAGARDLFARERVGAALSTRRWRLGVDVMTAWLALNERRKTETETWVRAALHEFPITALSLLLVDWDKYPARPEEREAREWIEREVIQLLTREALAKKDARLSRELLAHSPIWLRASESGDQLAILATQAEEAARVVGRVVGIVLGGQTIVERRRNVQVVTGLLEGLGLGHGGSEELRVVAEEDRGSTATTLAALSSQGASLLIAGATAESALLALKFAEARQVPVIALTAPDESLPDLQYGFVLGESERAQRSALERGLEALGIHEIALVGDGGVPCERAPTRPDLPTFPIAAWSSAKVRAFTVLGDPSCVRQLGVQSAGLSPHPLLAVGLEAAEGPWPAGVAVIHLTAGEFPTGQKAELSDRLAPEKAARPPVASWFELLGADLSLLSRAVLGELPLTPVSEESEVRARHDRVREGLLGADVQLRSTSARGFSGKHTMARTLGIATRGTP